MKYLLLFLLAAWALSACTPATLSPTQAPSDTPAPSLTPSLTASPTLTLTPSITFTPTLTPSPTLSLTPTFAFPSATVNKQAHCRYGPAIAYLHAADLYAGDTGSVRGRHPYSSWLYVKFDKLSYLCWVAPTVVDVTGDVSKLEIKEPNVETIGESFYGPPDHVTAVRDGPNVTISWDQVHMTHDQDRGYFIEAYVCQDGLFLWWTFSYPDQFKTTYTVRDEIGCPLESYGTIYTVTKEGYSKGKAIPWP